MSYASEFVLTLFTNDAALATAADQAGVERIGIDMEQIGKGAMAYYLNRRYDVPGWEVASVMLFIMFGEVFYLLVWASVGYIIDLSMPCSSSSASRGAGSRNAAVDSIAFPRISRCDLPSGLPLWK